MTCDSCSNERSLRGITEARFDQYGEEHTNLSDRLESPEAPYLMWPGRSRGWRKSTASATSQSAGLCVLREMSISRRLSCQSTFHAEKAR